MFLILEEDLIRFVNVKAVGALAFREAMASGFVVVWDERYDRSYCQMGLSEGIFLLENYHYGQA